ncbi:MAG: hypothetical protein AAF928_15520 [Myxococcota bacterium]
MNGSAMANLAGVPGVARPLWRQLVAEPLRPVHELFGQVQAYRDDLALPPSPGGQPEVDRQLARALADRCLQLLGTLHDDSPDHERRLVQAAVRYFLIEDDAEADLDSILGLDDDARVLNAVLTHLGHENWLVEEL